MENKETPSIISDKVKETFDGMKLDGISLIDKYPAYYLIDDKNIRDNKRLSVGFIIDEKEFESSNNVDSLVSCYLSNAHKHMQESLKS